MLPLTSSRALAFVRSNEGSIDGKVLSEAIGLTCDIAGANATVNAPPVQMRCARSMSVPRRSSRSTDGSAERGSTTARLLKKSVGLNPRAAPLLRLMRPASTYVLSKISQLTNPSRHSLIRFCWTGNARSFAARTLRRSLNVNVRRRPARHSRRTSTNTRSSHVDVVDDGTGTRRALWPVEPVKTFSAYTRRFAFRLTARSASADDGAF